MALSDFFVSQHIEHWSNELGSGFYSYRKHWPACLFHHAPLENALGILRDGHIRSRNDPMRQRLRDVAAAGVIDNTHNAHNRVRLYFRPKTPTQYHIEGIRKDHECQYGTDSHAPVLVMFVLDAQKILTLPNVLFSDQNMQRGDASTGSDEAFFGAIPFNKVFHEGGISGDTSITAHRCAEILPESPLALEGVLSGIWFRSEPERDTLLHLLGDERSKWEKYCRVSEELKVFNKKHAFVVDIGLSNEGVHFRINYRHDLNPIDILIEAKDEGGNVCLRFKKSEFTSHNNNAGRWIYRKPLEPSKYLVKVHIEGHLAYEGWIALGDSLV